MGQWYFRFLVVWWINRASLIEGEACSCPRPWLCCLLPANWISLTGCLLFWPMTTGERNCFLFSCVQGRGSAGSNIFLIHYSLLRDCCRGIWSHRFVTSYAIGSLSVLWDPICQCWLREWLMVLELTFLIENTRILVSFSMTWVRSSFATIAVHLAIGVFNLLWVGLE